ncbi:MAG: hypothetical protein CVT81_00930 [Alphaproteobacteria bacterium HGW-Alphaproteobacteria-3]|nr:MAG: hypothetical protein CVT81_00930 [Alphaproteobacteria bacterium HGW-Alphaproteobacteria-3]
MIYGALIWIAEKLRSDQSEQARELWATKGRQAFEEDHAMRAPTKPQDRA